jgi:hypothetical protein
MHMLWHVMMCLLLGSSDATTISHLAAEMLNLSSFIFTTTLVGCLPSF